MSRRRSSNVRMNKKKPLRGKTKETYDIKEIVSIRRGEEEVEFLVAWDVGGENTWEPLSNFGNGKRNAAILAFKKKHPSQYEEMLKGRGAPPTSGEVSTGNEEIEEPTANQREVAMANQEEVPNEVPPGTSVIEKRDKLKRAIISLNVNEVVHVINENNWKEVWCDLIEEGTLQRMLLHYTKTSNNFDDEQYKFTVTMKVVLNSIDYVCYQYRDRTERKTLLHYAILNKEWILVECILEGDSPIDLRDKNGYTALEICILEKDTFLFEMLLKRGAASHHIKSLWHPPGSDKERFSAHMVNLLETELQSSVEVLRILQKYSDLVKENFEQLRYPLFADHDPVATINIPFGDCTMCNAIQFIKYKEYIESECFEKFYLMISSLVWNEREKRFDNFSSLPYIVPVVDMKQCTFVQAGRGFQLFDATLALKERASVLPAIPPVRTIYRTNQEEIDNFIAPPFNPSVHYISLTVRPEEHFSFLSCQIFGVRYPELPDGPFLH